jgi:PAT family beta-lactamase induction signal transducer AmpG
MAQARTVLAASSGYLAVSFGWVGFFLLTTVAALPGLLVLIVLQRRMCTLHTAAPPTPASLVIGEPRGS